MECVFCHKENLVTEIIYEDDIVLAFMDIDPINPDHVLLIPKAHYLDVDEIPDDVLAHLMLVAKQIVSALKDILSPDGYSMMQNGGEFNDIGHYHLHIFPRYKEDGFSWQYEDTQEKDATDIAAELGKIL